MAYEINYEDPKFKAVEAQKDAALSENEKLYGGMAEETGKFYEAQLDASRQWEQTQTQLQKEQTDFALEKLQQQKDQAEKDYLKEQSGAYTDWQKQMNQYGVNAEQQAAVGMSGTGYSESAQVSMYNTYQNRVAKARETFNRAVVDYDNAMKDARLQNNSKLAAIAFEALQTRLELSLQGFQYKNQLLLDSADKKLQFEKLYQDRWQEVLEQMNTENALAEQIRQFNASLEEKRRQFDVSLEEERRQFDLRYGGLWAQEAPVSSGGGSYSAKKADKADKAETPATANMRKELATQALRPGQSNRNDTGTIKINGKVYSMREV